MALVAFVNLFAARAVALFHLAESPVTNRHGECPLLYLSWAMLLQALFVLLAAASCRCLSSPARMRIFRA